MAGEERVVIYDILEGLPKTAFGSTKVDQPRDILSLAVKASSGTTDATTSINWNEE